MKTHLKYFLYLCFAVNFITGNSNEIFLKPEAHESSLRDKVDSHEPRALIFNSMGNRYVCIEIDGVFYESMTLASRMTEYAFKTIKKRCLSNKHPNYKIVSFRITYTEKECAKCGNMKLLKEFGKDISIKDGLKTQCKSCKKTHYKSNIEKIKQISKEYYQKHITEAKIYYQVHKKEINARQKEKRKNNPMYRLNRNMSNAMYKSLKTGKGGAHWEALGGYTCSELIAHLEKQFTEGMTWENYGEWHIDHIIPLYWFVFEKTTDKGFKKAWALENLRPMWGADNIRKGNKLFYP